GPGADAVPDARHPRRAEGGVGRGGPDGHERRAAGAGHLEVDDGIADVDGPRRRDAELVQRLEERLGVRLPVLDVVRVDGDLERVHEVEAGAGWAPGARAG